DGQPRVTCWPKRFCSHSHRNAHPDEHRRKSGRDPEQHVASFAGEFKTSHEGEGAVRGGQVVGHHIDHPAVRHFRNPDPDRPELLRRYLERTDGAYRSRRFGGVGDGREYNHVPYGELRDLMQPSTSMFAGLSRLIEDNTEPLLAVSMFGFVFLSVLAIIHAVQSRAAIRKRTVAYNPAYSRPQSLHLPG